MIAGHKIVVGLVMTNVVDNGYWPVTVSAVQSYANTNFVDEIVIVDGQSSDATVSCHSQLPKVKFLQGPKWNTDTDNLSEDEFSKQRNVLYRYCDELGVDAVLIFQCPDTLFTDKFRQECEAVTRKMLTDDGDYCVVPYAKFLNPWQYLRYNHKIFDDRWSEMCLLRFRTGKNEWTRRLLDDEKHLDLTGTLVKHIHNWRDVPLTYDLWHFDREKFYNRLVKRAGVDHTIPIDTLIAAGHKKIRQNVVHTIKLAEHPSEARGLLENLKETHYGFSSFGYFKEVPTFEEYLRELRGE